MQEILEFIQGHVSLAPPVIFGLFMLAGLSVPISEDLLIFCSAILASEYPTMAPQFFLAVYLGAYLSDILCYSFFGRYLGHKIFQVKFLPKWISKKNIQRVSNFYDKHGLIVLILGRFIPFGVRNALLISAGLGKMKAWKFLFADLLACTLTTTVFFSLYYHFGKDVVVYVRRGNLTLFTLVALAITFWIIRKKYFNQKEGVP